ncbi:MAG: ABC transporter permease, partial [Devosiaceae bacterium]|nr:ABC transporter permease [Devosiaceae bacterium]
MSEKKPIGLIEKAFSHLSFRIGFFGTIIFFIIALISIFWTPFDIANLDIYNRFAPISFSHILGTDFYGRDMLSLLMSGALTSFIVAIIAVLIGLLIGVPLGLIAASYGGWLDAILSRTNDFLFAFPAIISAIIITTIFGPSAINAMIAIGIFNIPVFARVARGGALSIKMLDYIDAARLSGMGTLEIAFRHIFPNIASLIIVQASVQLSLGILAEAGLSYLGLGTQPPQTSLGLMLQEAQSFFLLYPMLAILPGLTIMFIVICINLLGDGLRDALDPKLARE